MSGAERILKALKSLNSYPEELKLDLERPDDRFRWFLGSMLFAKRISSTVAMRTFQVLRWKGYDSPESILSAGWEKLVEALDMGGYVRYDFSTADKLLEVCGKLREKDLETLYAESPNQEAFEEALLQLKGVGPKTVEIFLRELEGIWDVKVPLSKEARGAMSRLGLKQKDLPKDPRELSKVRSVLVRLWLERCKRGKHDGCPLASLCPSAEAA